MPTKSAEGAGESISRAARMLAFNLDLQKSMMLRREVA